MIQSSQQSNKQLNIQPNMQQVYDLLIIGSGPAGLAASIYASRYKLTNLVIGKILGGTMTYAHRVENYPGFASISGVELAQKMGDQVKSLGAEIINDEVIEIKNHESGIKNFLVTTKAGKEFESRALIVATGTERRKLNIPGEAEYLGKGVSYCTTCDIPLFKDKTVVVVGGADSACTGAIHAADFASRVYLIYRKEALRAEPAWVHEVQTNPKIKVIYNTNLVEIKGDGNKVTGIVLDQKYQESPELAVDGIFIEIGGVPLTSLLAKLGVTLDENGFVKVAPDMSTNIGGVYAAGDLANVFGEMHQITIATSEGSVAAASAFKYLKGQQAPVSYGEKK